jgi:hypothetical protein
VKISAYAMGRGQLNAAFRGLERRRDYDFRNWSPRVREVAWRYCGINLASVVAAMAASTWAEWRGVCEMAARALATQHDSIFRFP